MCVCAGWGLDNKAGCAVLLSDLLRFFLPLLLPCADIEEMRERLRRRHKGGELGEKGALMATLGNEGDQCKHLVLSNKNIKSLVSLYLVRCKNDFLSKKT